MMAASPMPCRAPRCALFVAAGATTGEAVQAVLPATPVVTLQQANDAAAQDAVRYAGRVADLLEQSHGFAEARPAPCRVGHVLESAESEQCLGPSVCRSGRSRN